jgi:AcrR family transcriptional regulator
MANAQPDVPITTRQAILDASMALFLSQGFHGTSMRQIAYTAGVSLGAAYNYFSGKYEIFRHLINERNPYLQVASKLAIMPNADATGQLDSAARAFVASLSDNADFIRLAMIDILEFQGTTIGQAASIGLPAISSFFQQLASLGVQQDEFRPLSSSVLVRAVVGMALSSAILQSLARPVGELLPDEDWISEYIDILHHGVVSQRRLNAGCRADQATHNAEV